MAIDSKTWDQANWVLKNGIARGLHPVEALEIAGLLLSRDARHRIQVQALQTLLNHFRNWTPAEYLHEYDPIGPYTPQQMFEAVDRFIEQYVQHLAEHPES